MEPAEPQDVHRKLPKRTDLACLFAETHTRTVANDFTIRYKSRRLQIPKSQARGIRPGQKVTIELRLDGSAMLERPLPRRSNEADQRRGRVMHNADEAARMPTAPRTGAPGNVTEVWPPLALEEWRETYGTLHMMTQVVGKIRLACSPMLNHWWHVPLYVTARGLTTSAMPYGVRTFQVDFDLIDHQLRVDVSDGGRASFSLLGKPVAMFYREVMKTLEALDVAVTIWTRPVEVENPIPFDVDHRHEAYEPEEAHRFWQVLRQADRVLEEFRSGFVGKSSPVHFFWGSFDLAVTRFSGRRAPNHPGGVPNLADWVSREAYSRECSSCGFWPGSGAVQEAAFYAYAYPEPEGYRRYSVRPREASYVDDMREFILPYEAVRNAADGDRMLHEFLRSTYAAAAELGAWDRKDLEDSAPVPSREASPSASFPRHERAPGTRHRG